MRLSDRTYGVELEHGNRQLQPGDVKNALLKEYPKWANAHKDGSGIEVVSPILKGVDGLEELKAVMGFLEKLGGYMSAKDGLHVHHDGVEFLDDPKGRDRAVHLITSWSNNQSAINSILPVRRCNNEHLEGTTTACYKQIDVFKLNETVAAVTSTDLAIPRCYSGADRFSSLNLKSLYDHGTVEIRQHHGTWDFDRAAAWIRFGQRFVEYTLENGIVRRHNTASALFKTLELDAADATKLKEVPA